MKKTFLIIFLILFFIPVSTFALCEGPIVPCGREGTPPCTLCHLFEIFNNILEFLLTCVVPIIGGAMLVFGGAVFLISGADPNLFAKAKGIVTATIVGIIIVFSSWVLLNTFLTFIGIAEWVGIDEGGWTIVCAYSSGNGGGNGGGQDGGDGQTIRWCGDCLKTDSQGNCVSKETTTWGELANDPNYTFNCKGENQRCYEGECKTCEGIVAPDGLGGVGCWYKGTGAFRETCDNVCSGHGGCVPGDWRDDTECTVMKELLAGEGGCSSCGEAETIVGWSYVCDNGAPYIYIDIFGNRLCKYRCSNKAQSCSEFAPGSNPRACICNF